MVLRPLYENHEVYTSPLNQCLDEEAFLNEIYLIEEATNENLTSFKMIHDIFSSVRTKLSFIIHILFEICIAVYVIQYQVFSFSTNRMQVNAGWRYD